MKKVPAEARNCLACDKLLKGRSDKKFCNDACRNHYNNQLKAITNHSMESVTEALDKNRRILKSMIPDGKQSAKTTRDQLTAKGFLFKYVTDLDRDASGETSYYCYDFGYRMVGEEEGVLVVKKDFLTAERAEKIE
jgi:hypothetical protein